MTGREFEAVLRAAAEKLPEGPETVLTAPVKCRKRRFSRRAAALLAAAAAALLLCVGAGAQQLLYYYHVYPFNYLPRALVQWIGGVRFPDALGDYSLRSCQLGVFQSDNSFQLLYHTSSAEYSYQGKGGLALIVGKTDNLFWTTVYGYDPETLEHSWTVTEAYKDDYRYENIRTESYQGYTIYLAEEEPLSEDYGGCEIATWVDEESGTLFWLSNGVYDAETAVYGMQTDGEAAELTQLPAADTMDCVRAVIELNN